MNMPIGGKLLAAEDSAQLGRMSPAAKDELIAGIVSKLRAQQRWRDKSSMTQIARQERRKARVSELRRELADLEGRP